MSKQRIMDKLVSFALKRSRQKFINFHHISMRERKRKRLDSIFSSKHRNQFRLINFHSSDSNGLNIFLQFIFVAVTASYVFSPLFSLFVHCDCKDFLPFSASFWLFIFHVWTNSIILSCAWGIKKSFSSK